MKLRELLLQKDDEEAKAEREVRLAKNFAEKQIIELECDLEEKRHELKDRIREDFDLLYIVEEEQEIAVMEDLLKRAKAKMEELF